MKITVFNGSPAAANSSTQVIAEAFLRGAQRAGAQTETVFLAEQNIFHCKGCFACWFQTPGKCVMQDDMAALLQKYNGSDIVCFATPVYTWNMTAMMKNFVDRLAPLKSPQIVEDHGGFDLEDSVRKTQKFVVISNCGFPGDNNFAVMKQAFACCSPTLELYRNCGRLLKSKRKDVQLVVAQYLDAVGQAGFALASTGAVSDEIRQSLEMPLMSVSDYVSYLGM